MRCRTTGPWWPWTCAAAAPRATSPGPTGLTRHADDLTHVAAAIDPEETGDLVLLGHSMGAYAALLTVDDDPTPFRRLVLVDGGVPLPVPEGVDHDELLAATLGPALARLSQTYEDAEAYVDLFRAHPALGPHWSPDIETYVRYDALETADGVRSRAVEEAVRSDGRDLLVLGEELDEALRSAAAAHDAARGAPRDVRRGPGAAARRRGRRSYDAALDDLTVETIDGVNHYTILFDPAAVERVVAAVVG